MPRLSSGSDAVAPTVRVPTVLFSGSPACPLAAAVASLALLGGASSAHAAFVGYVVTSTTTTHEGQSLVVYTLAARFDGPTDTVYRAFDLTTSNTSWLYGFWHKDHNSDDLSDPVLSQSHGTWDPSRTGSSASNRPYDSYLTIGGIANFSNATRDSYDDIVSAQLVSPGWDRASLPWGNDFEWYNSQPGNNQGRAGQSAGLAATDVRLGQFVLSAGHDPRTFALSIKFNSGDWLDRDGDGEGDGMEIASGDFTLGVPAPGALAILGLAGLAGGRRRRS
ncbi:MAG: hypothetical protein RL354_1740 [Planctomycetota bacterium]